MAVKINSVRCYFEPVVNGTNRVFLPDGEQLKVSSLSLCDQSCVHLLPAHCTLSITASYEKSVALVKVENVSVVYIDRKATNTADVIKVSVGTVVEIHPGALIYILEFSNIPKQCINQTVEESLDLLRLKTRLYRWDMFTGGQLLVCTSEGFDDKRKKVAAYDLDGTLIKSKLGSQVNDHKDWMLWDDSVVDVLSELHDNGYKVIIFTNQGGLFKSESALNLQFFKTKVENVIDALRVPIQVYIATFFGGPYRKPVPGMWRLMEWNCGMKMNLEESFFVGDAAGRQQDFAASDRIFAENIGLKFHTPEESFLNETPAVHAGRKFHFDCFNLNLKMPDLEVPSKVQEAIIMVGPPSSGKTAFIENYLIPAGYVPVSLDYFDDWNVSTAVLDNILKRNKNAVIDNRNWEVSDRWKFIYLCNRRQVKVRCFIMDWSVNRCAHNNKFKKIFDPNYGSLSPTMLEQYIKKFQPPTMGEGFAAILSIPFIPTFGCDEMKFLYNCYLHAQ